MSSEAAEKMNMYETMMESLVSDDSRFMLDGKEKFSSSIEVTLAYFLQIDGRFKNWVLMMIIRFLNTLFSKWIRPGNSFSLPTTTVWSSVCNLQKYPKNS